MTLWVKICGVGSEAAIDAAVTAGADAIGLVHFAPSPRHLDLERMAELADHARGRAEIVSLTVDADAATLAAITERVRPDTYQLHGSEDSAQISALRDATGSRIMKAVGIRDLADIGRAQTVSQTVDRLLVDAKPPRDATRPGGNGAAFDWDLLAALDARAPLVLSGGLTAATVGDAVLGVAPWGIDASSGVETAPGEKSPALIVEFVAAARAAERREPAPHPRDHGIRSAS